MSFNFDTSLMAKDLESVCVWLNKKDPSSVNVELTYVDIDFFINQINEMESTYNEFVKDKHRSLKIYELLKNGDSPQPVYVEKNDIHNFVMEGRHRMVAFKWAGLLQIPVAYVS